MTLVATAAPRPVITFEEEPHLYRADGRPVDSVTQILKAVYPEIWPWANEFAMERGRRVHKALHLFAIGDLDWKSLSPYIAGFVAAGVRFLQESGFQIARLPNGELATETRMYSAIYDFAGTSDLFGAYVRRDGCFDYKTGEPGWACGPQTWAYTQMYQEMFGIMVRDRYGVHLHDDGTYDVIPYKNNRDDQADFLAARRVLSRRRMLAA